MEGLEALSEILDRQTGIQSRLLEYERKKTGVLLKGDTAALDALVMKEQPLIMSCRNIERQREITQKRLGLGGLSLRETIDGAAGADGAERLQEQLVKLSAIMEELRKVSDTNQKLLNSRLSTVNWVMQAAGIMNEETVTYKKR